MFRVVPFVLVVQPRISTPFYRLMTVRGQAASEKVCPKSMGYDAAYAQQKEILRIRTPVNSFVGGPRLGPLN